MVEGTSAPDYPLQKKRHSFEYLRTISHLRPRTNTFQAVFRVRSLIAYAIHQYFQDRGFVYVHTPLIDVYKRQSWRRGKPLSFPARKLIDLTRECMRNHPELDYTAFRFCRPEEVENLI